MEPSELLAEIENLSDAGYLSHGIVALPRSVIFYRHPTALFARARYPHAERFLYVEQCDDGVSAVVFIVLEAGTFHGYMSSRPGDTEQEREFELAGDALADAGRRYMLQLESLGVEGLATAIVTEWKRAPRGRLADASLRRFIRQSQALPKMDPRMFNYWCTAQADMARRDNLMEMALEKARALLQSEEIAWGHAWLPLAIATRRSWRQSDIEAAARQAGMWTFSRESLRKLVELTTARPSTD